MVLAATGIARPLLMLMAEGLWLRTGRPHDRDPARKFGPIAPIIKGDRETETLRVAKYRKPFVVPVLTAG
jgi:hypothetical protein